MTEPVELYLKQCNASQSLFRDPRARLVILLILFVAAFGIRLHHITSAPFDFAPIRQYQQAHIARAYYYEGQDALPEWKKKIGRLNMKRMGFVLEPRIIEHMSVFAYRILGAERLWIPRLMSVIFWMVGGLFLYLIARNIASPDAAFFSTIFYLFLPYGILASRSFQPDPMMLMMSLGSIYTILLYFETQSTWRLIIAAVVSSIAFLIKPFCLFPVFGVFISVSVYRQGFWKACFNSRFFMFSFISLIPTTVYYVYGVFAQVGFLRDFTQISFLPHLFLYAYFWKDWLRLIGEVVGYIPFMVAFIGFLMIRRGTCKAVLLGLWTGYFALGFFATYHIHTHSYYHLPLIPTVALSLGPVAVIIMRRISHLFFSWKGMAVICTAILVLILGAGFHIRHMDRENLKKSAKTLGSFTGVTPQFYAFITSDYEKEVQALKEIGDIVEHSTNTIFLTSDFGRALAYEGELSGLPWPTSSSLQGRKEQGIPLPGREEIFNERYLTVRTHGKYIKYTPDFFIITDFEEFEKQPVLRTFLDSRFPLIAKTDDYLIYDSRKMSGLNP